MFEKHILIFSIQLIFLVSCSSNSLEDYREEAEGVTRSILKEISAIHTRDELNRHLPKLKKQFDKLVDVMIAANEFKSTHPMEVTMFTSEEQVLNECLLAELTRLYSISGGRGLMEKAQQDALYRLDAYLKKKKANTQVIE